ncbi:MAG: hypothetical protein ACJZ7Z_11970 [Myxococcota bacterium]
MVRWFRGARMAPARFRALPRIRASRRLRRGGDYSLALRADGSIASWGSDFTFAVSNAPTDSDFTAIAAGQNHSLALRSDGSLVSWGA